LLQTLPQAKAEAQAQAQAQTHATSSHEVACKVMFQTAAADTRTGVAPKVLQDEIAQLRSEVSRLQAAGDPSLARVLLKDLKAKLLALRQAGYTSELTLANQLSQMEQAQEDRNQFDAAEGRRIRAAQLKELDFQPWIERFQLKSSNSQQIDFRSASLSPDGKSLLILGLDGFVTLWDIKSGHKKFEIGDRSYETKIAMFSPDDKHILTIGSQTDPKAFGTTDITPFHTSLTIRNADTGETISTLNPKGIRFIQKAQFLPDGQSLLIEHIVQNKLQLAIFDLSTNSISARLATSNSTDFLVLHAMTSGGGIVESTREPIELATHYRISSDGRFVVATEAPIVHKTIGDPTIYIYNTKNGKALASLAGHIGDIGLIEFSADNSKVLTYSNQDEAIRIWSLKAAISANDAREQDEASHSNKPSLVVKLVRFVRKLSSQSTAKDQVQCISCQTYKTPNNGTFLAKASPTMKNLLTIDLELIGHIFDADTGNEIFNIDFGHHAQVGEPPTGATFSYDGKLLAISVTDGTVQIWNALTGKFLQTLRMGSGDQKLVSISFSPDDTQLIATAENLTTIVWQRGADK
jgi:WD40 repeat protein